MPQKDERLRTGGRDEGLSGSPDSPSPAASSAVQEAGGQVDPGESRRPDSGDGPGLSDEIDHFLTTLARAVQKYSMYPPGHPALQPVVSDVVNSLRELLVERTLVAVGVATRQLAVEGTETDPENERLAGLAGRLHRHQLASLTFERGVESQEVADLLTMIAVEPELSEQPLGHVPREELPEWPHLRVEAIHYERLGLAGGGNGANRSDVADPESESRTRSTNLWLGLARAALVGDAVGDASYDESSEASPLDDLLEQTETMARALDEYSSDEAYAEEVLHQLLEMSRELRASSNGFDGGGPTADLRRRASLLISLVKPESLRQMLRRGGSTRDRVQLLLDAARWMEPGAVVKLLRATAGVEDENISHWLVLMLNKLATHASSGTPTIRRNAEANLRTQVELLVSDWGLEGAVPPEYADALERMATREKTARKTGEGAAKIEPERVLMTALEVGQMGAPVSAAVDEMLADGRLAAVISLLDGVPETNPVAPAVWKTLEGPATVMTLLEEDPPNFEALDLLIERIRVQAADPMLAVLAESESLSTRRKLFSRLAGLGPQIGRSVIRWLGDERWFVKRNMLALLGELERWPPKWSPADYAKHPHNAVRREALKLMLKEPENRDAAVCALLADDDSRSLTLGLAAAVERCPPEAQALLLDLAEDEALPMDQRILATRALTGRGHPSVVPGLLQLARGKRNLFFRLIRRERVAEKSPVTLHALFGLFHSGDPRAQRLLARARRSHDPEIRAAAEGRLKP